MFAKEVKTGVGFGVNKRTSGVTSSVVLTNYYFCEKQTAPAERAYARSVPVLL